MNICAFELGFGYGVARALEIYFRPEPPRVLASLVSLVAVTVCSAYVVLRYMPSDVVIQSLRGAYAGVLWINASLLLAAAIPIVSLLYSDSLLFWLTAVLVAATKAIHSLETRRRNQKDLVFAAQTSTGKANEGFHGKHIFSPNPDAFALQPLLTSLLIAGTALGIAMVVVDQQRFLTIGIWIIAVCSSTYNVLSGISRRRAKRAATAYQSATPDTSRR
jgi:hypothetical protein